MRISSVLCLAVSASVAVCTVQTASAQATPASTESVGTLHIQAQEVVLPVTVRDKHGELVTTLQKSDFTLTDNGHPQVIKSFSRETNLPFRIGMLVDTSRSMSGVLPAVRTATGQFIDLMLPAAPTQSKDQAFLLHFDREVELLQDFTNSREKLSSELTDLGPTSGERYEVQSSGSGNGGDNNGNGGDQSHHSRGGTTLYDAIYLASNELMKPKDGRKALVVFSDGADRGSKETLNDAVDAADRANVAIYTIYFKGEEERGNNGGFPGGGRHGGGFPGGGGWPGGGGGWPGGGGRGGQQPRSATGIDGRKIMREIAERTGGHAFEAKKKEDLDAIYKLIEQELRNQYLLTYTPDKLDADGSFHRIALKANNGDLTVETREGYYAPGGDQ